MATGADTFPARGGALWPVLNDEELAAVSSSSASASATASTTQPQRLLLPSTSHAQLNELSAFLAASAATSGAASGAAAPPTFLDDLLRDDGDAAQQMQLHEDVPVSSAMLSDAAFFSLGEETHRATTDSSSAGSPSTSTSTTRLLQLETNYEQKKKRAKINRKDLNSRFQELMDILHLKEDRKLNRAKILEKTIEHIEKLTAELNALKGGHQPQQQPQAARKTAVALHHQQQFHGMQTMAQAIGHHSIASSAHGSVAGGAPLLPYNPSQWSAAGVGTSLPLPPMMWVPCPVVTSSGMMLKRAAPGRPADTSIRKRGRVESMESAVTSSSEVESGPESPEVATTVVSSVDAKESSLFVWSAQEIPTLLAFCDAWTLATVMRTSRELRSAASSEKLWEELCRDRWRISPEINIIQPREQWQQWHETNHIPTDITKITCVGIRFASGRANNVSVWGLLSHRSNGRTTRTVLLNGKATVMQVVELFIVVQNLTLACVRVTDCISLTSKLSSHGVDKASFEPFTAASGAHLTPQVVAFNADHCATKDLASVALQHGDICVISVFMACPGLDLEDQFLQRAGSLNIKCEIDTRGDVKERVDVRAACKDHNDYDRIREKAMLAVHRGVI